ncbi:cation-binding protein [Catellatospora sp. TT07R-123]|uniref:hemerythrin domain-containing protein n=1 Tax=Catellatospora sp. TT07R-123 TaxID=2733863 RepID=UPI001B12E84D|nr:hemerythrin domain-containing protein [Catellatospora sp. TT07R-123]GHJ47079.1 cation-binding protein [Catellatospora sp. TT07R-123]
MDDITALILDDHAAFRRGFARLDDAKDAEQMRAVWEPLALHLEIHAEAEERILYPHLLRRGGEHADEESLDAIRDHNKIRDAIAESRRHEVGTDPWWSAVWRARRENTEHLGEEEDEGLPDFRRHASDELRARLGAQWLAFYGEHPSGKGLTFRDKDPQRYVAAARSQSRPAQA